MRSLIGKYRGRLIEAAEALNHRIWNFYRNESKGWIEIGGRYDGDSYYFRSWAYRLLNLLAVARLFEKEAIFIDAEIAGKADLDFIKYAKAFSWATCDVVIFECVNYPGDRQEDHLFKDTIRLICDACCKDGNFLDQEAVHAILEDHRYRAIYRFLDGLKRGEGRTRWDRMVVLDLLVMAFLNKFGYETQRSSQEDFDKAVNQIEHEKILGDLKFWMGRLGLNQDAGAAPVLDAIEGRLESRPTPR